MPWAIVTASTRGIGYTAALALAEEGYSLVVTSRDPARSKGVVDKLLERGAPNAVLLQLDLSREESVKRFIIESERVLQGSLRVMVINYGNPSCEPCTLASVEWRDWIEAAGMYLASTSELLRFASKYERVRAIIISSFTTSELHPGLILADTVRRGLEALVKAATYEYKGRVLPVLLRLGSFRTPGAVETIKRLASKAGVDPEEYWRREVESRSPLQRAGRLEELKEVIKFLARAPDYLVGSSILFDGASSKCY